MTVINRKTALLCLVLVSSFLIICFTSGLNAQITPNVNQDLKIVAYGDSLVVGVGSTPSNDFVSVLSDRIGVPIINMGSSGLTTGRAVQEVTDTVISQVDPDLVILVLGGNDVLQGVPISQMETNIRTVIERIKASGASVVLAAVHGPSFLTSRERVFRDLADELDVVYVSNLMSGIVGNPLVTSDLVHPNDRGYEILADRIFPKLQEAINDLPDQDLTVTCAAENNQLTTNGKVRWRAYATGGEGRYDYSWSGSDDLRSSSSSVSKTYKTSGQKTATVAVTSGGQTVTEDCDGFVTVTDPVLIGSCSVRISQTREGFKVRYSVRSDNVSRRDTTYSWSGTDGLAGSKSSVTQEYSTAGLKSATVTIQNGTQTLPLTCSALIVQNDPQGTTSRRFSSLGCSNSTSRSRGVTWRASGSSRYGYSWSGTDGLTSTTNKVSKIYETAGLKEATVQITQAEGFTGTLKCQAFVEANNT